MATLPANNEPGLARSADLAVVVGVLALASAIELLVLRTFTRTAIHIPALNSLQEPYERVTEGGQYAYFAALALMLPALALLWMTFGRRDLAASCGVLLFSSAAVFAAAGPSNRALLDATTLAAVTVLAGAVALRMSRPAAATPIACFAGAFALSGSYSVIPALSEVGLAFEQPDILLNAAEFAGLAFALASPLLLDRRTDGVSRGVAAAIGLLALAFFLGNGSTSRFLLLWNVGLAGALPGFAYAVAAAALALTISALFRRGNVLAAAGLVLLVTGGIGLHSTYQSGLVVVGLAALYRGYTFSEVLGERCPEPAHA